ncbi:MAG: hypothetical protein L6V93_20600 [Clostridiales bacterium]|nr:MAG: hypothetical protein L6V93_20600 [Clostridiales bacterium]
MNFFRRPTQCKKVELMMNSGGDELPDIICGVNFTDGALAGYGDAGMIIPLNAYYENSAYYINDAFEKEKGFKEYDNLIRREYVLYPQLCKGAPE